KSVAHAFVEHPLGAIVEYPQTGDAPDQSIAHIFNIDPTTFHSSQHPKANFQYSLGNVHGSRDVSKCLMLRDGQGQPVSCSNLKTSCKWLKICSARPHDTTIHHFTNILEVSSLIIATTTAAKSVNDAEKEVFQKTFAFFIALNQHGCTFDAELNSDTSENGDVTDITDNSVDDTEHGLTPDHRAHLLIWNIQECDTQYLRALLEDDRHTILEREDLAKSRGYGPLIPCNYVTSPSSQRQLYGKLKQGVLQKWGHNCSAKYDIFTPHDLHACPRILVVCRNPHSHPPPAPVKTPPGLVNLFYGLLALMKWKLADATPCRIFLDTAFIEGLHDALAWDSTLHGRDATLQDLHPSLANLDHVRRLITTFRNEKYPSGTGFEGAHLLANEHASLPPKQCYVHCAEVHPIERGKELKLVICMTTKMSQHLLQAKHLSIDTSFKRAQGWQEFEIESWDVDHMRSVVGARAFTTSQTAKAHVILFQRIFEIASTNTGLPIMFHHIHGTGFKTIIADSHKGQGLGLGMYCVQLCHSVTAQCIYEPHCRICDLNPYDHLQHFFIFVLRTTREMSSRCAPTCHRMFFLQC
ncbi:uncharacterized protein HD556DRAFT_1245206, partial [Suillus plorans]